MSTPCTVHFTDGNRVSAIVYIHFDGDGVGEELEQFFDRISKETSETRFSDPSCLASRFVVYYALGSSSTNSPLNFLGIRIVLKDPLGINYRYTVDCLNRRDNGYPIVIKEKIPFRGDIE